MAGLGASMNTYNGPVPPGVPNPYTVMLHSYPTRYHGPIYTRPMYNLDWSQRPNDFGLQEGMMGLGEMQGLGEIPEEMYTPFWSVGLKNLFKTQDAIVEECNAIPGMTPEEIMACAGGRIVAAQSARAAVAVGVLLGAIGMRFYLKRKR
jgi:hypothetical protein